MKQFTEQAAQNNASRLGLLQSIAGTPDDVASAKAWRDQVANAKYGQAFDDFRSQQVVRAQNSQDAATEAATRKTLFQRPVEVPPASSASEKMVELSQRPAI